MKLFFKLIYGLFLVAVVSLALLLLVSFLPIPGNIEIRIVQSGSMEPAIKTGGIVVIKPTSSYKVGDVIMFGQDTSASIPTTHRIVADEVRNGVFFYTTKGDANPSQDPVPVSHEEVLGKVVLSISYLGYIMDFSKKPIGFILIIGIPALVVILDEAMKIKREMRKTDESEE